MSLHVETIGQGKPITFIHGWGMHGSVWDPIVPLLAPHYTLHLLDLPGMGFSAPIEDDSLTGMATTIAASMPDDGVVCAWSLGGQIAMQIALEAPQKIQRLVLVGSTPKFVNADDWLHGMNANVFHKFAANIEAAYEPTLMRFLTLQCMGSDDARSTLKQLRTGFEKRPVPSSTTLQHALDILLTTDLRKDVRNLQQPTLLLHGDHDTLAPIAAAEWLHETLPNSEYHCIEGASHAPFLSHPHVFAQHIQRFLSP